jgi:hypothetical protein
MILLDETLASVFYGDGIKKYSKIYFNGVAKYVKGDLFQLITEIKKYIPGIKFPVTVQG